jgi:hypothetical protein
VTTNHGRFGERLTEGPSPAAVRLWKAHRLARGCAVKEGYGTHGDVEFLAVKPKFRVAWRFLERQGADDGTGGEIDHLPHERAVETKTCGSP